MPAYVFASIWVTATFPADEHAAESWLRPGPQDRRRAFWQDVVLADKEWEEAFADYRQTLRPIVDG